MFKLESYITPILLSYVDKYIKNFRPEDSQVSLWGGDASFHNLDLRLEVLEQELQLPFSFVSGHIHELLIHVPWTKLASEPIMITINTIECILKLKGADSTESDSTSTSSVGKESKRKQHKQKDEIDAPPGYVQSLIKKIVNNICINCNNLILKYVEEDIVVSMNVKLLMIECADENWKSSFIDINACGQITLRKLITVSDLTVCLDKRNAAGKIDVYQEPMLYRCSLEMHFLRSYHSSTLKKSSTTRLDIYCSSMEFSMTEQQVPMLMRLIYLLMALQAKELKSDTNIRNDNENANIGEEGDEDAPEVESWAGWAWSFVPSILPASPEDEWPTDDQLAFLGHTLHIGFYVDYAVLAFKISEISGDRNYYTPRKLKQWPLLRLQLKGCCLNMMVHGFAWSNVQMGVSYAALVPQSHCSCGYPELNNETEHTEYFTAGSETETSHKTDSLFDMNSLENNGQRRMYNLSWDAHLNVFSETALLDKTPAFAVDYLYQLELPDDFTSEKLSEIGSDLEYSDIPERSLCRLVIGSTSVNVCSGLLHRATTLSKAASLYDYPPYSVPKPDPSRYDLVPPTEEDYNSLKSYIPLRVYQITLFKSVVEFQLLDHPKFDLGKGNLFRKQRKSVTKNNTNTPLPKLTIECQCLDAKYIVPMYVKRLVQTTCQLPTAPQSMFSACYTHVTVKILGLASQLILSDQKRSTVLMPAGVSFTGASMIKPQYWTDPNVSYAKRTLDIEHITVTVTKAKLLLIIYVIQSYLNQDNDVKNSISNTSLINDALNETGVAYLELCSEVLNAQQVHTISTFTASISLASIKGFIFDKANPVHADDLNGNPSSIQNQRQAMIISGPEFSSGSVPTEEALLFSATVQYPLNSNHQYHPPVLFFNLLEIKISADPLFCRWLMYRPQIISRTEAWNELGVHKNLSEASGSLMETPRRMINPQESVHSSSERDQLQSVYSVFPMTRVNLKETEVIKESSFNIYDFIVQWYPVWKGTVLSGDISSCTVYFPMISLSAVGMRGIQEALDNTMESKQKPDILVIKLPSVTVRSSAQKQRLKQYMSKFPISVPNSVWSMGKETFPWNIVISDFSCFTLQNGSKLYFVKPVSCNATIGLSTKYSSSEISQKTFENKSVGSSKSDETFNASTKKKTSSSHQSFLHSDSDSLISMGLYVHVDTAPVIISLCEPQICLMTSILNGIIDVTNSIIPELRSRHIPHKTVDTGIPTPINQTQNIPPSLFKDTTSESVSDQTPSKNTTESSEQVEDDSLKFSTWLQWTVARLKIIFYSHNIKKVTTGVDSFLKKPTLKLVFDTEDIMTSVDVQNVYTKVKSKVAYASIQHYKRPQNSKSWHAGTYLGLVMRGREDLLAPGQLREEHGNFLNITFTRACCSHVYNKWGTSKKQKLAEVQLDTKSGNLNVQSRHISELVVSIQPVDFVLSLTVLRNFIVILDPLLKIHHSPNTEQSDGLLRHINNKVLPLLYLECRELRIILPASDLVKKSSIHDVFLFQISHMSLNPSAENPICRTPIRPDIYQQAAQSRILNVPGSEVEDRQYQLNIVGISLNSSTWEQLESLLSLQGYIASNLRTMNENPALEWNNLGRGNGRLSMTPQLELLPVINKFDLCIVAAPSIVYKNNIIVCGHSMEVNFVSDIEVTICTSQIRIASALCTEFLHLFDPIESDFSSYLKTKMTSPYVQYYPVLNEIDDHKKSKISITDYIKDSGIDATDFSSDITGTKVCTSVTTETDQRASETYFGKVPSETSHMLFIPVEVLVTAGIISVALYHIDGPLKGCSHTKQYFLQNDPQNDDQGYEASEDSSQEDLTAPLGKIYPLLFLKLSQPNIFFSRFTFGRKLQISCFDLKLKISGPNYIENKGTPSQDDYSIDLLETKPGEPNPDTGIPPAFVTVKWSKGYGRTGNLELEIARPTKLHFSLTRWSYVLIVRDRIMECLCDENTSVTIMTTTSSMRRKSSNYEPKEDSTKKNSTPDTYSKFNDIKNKLFGICNLNLKLSQLVLSIKTQTGFESSISCGKLNTSLLISNRPERLSILFAFECFTLSMIKDGQSRLLLNPWNCSLDVCLFWETWQSSDSDPQIQISTESDSILLEIGPEHLKCLDTVFKEYKEFLNQLCGDQNDESIDRIIISTESIPAVEKDQYYKDDLRAGAFQFVDANMGSSEELPLPYQVVFSKRPEHAMAWRYPQPRALTKVRVFPMPFKISQNPSDDQQVSCRLEYWSDCRGSYQPFVEFELSESEMCQLDLPRTNPQPAVACIWRVVLSTSIFYLDNSNTLVSPRALAACVRIDSYFNPILIPRVQLSLTLSSIQIALINHIDTSLQYTMPEPLETYKLDEHMPENQNFLIFTLENSRIYSGFWDISSVIFEIDGSVKCDVLDYEFLSKQLLIESFTGKLSVSIANSLNVNVVAKPINIRFGPSVAHTLAVSAQVWKNYSESSTTTREAIVVTRYVICNDTNESILFGQAATDEDIFLKPSYCHLYSWRSQKSKLLLRIGLFVKGWNWSKPFAIDVDGTSVCNINDEDNLYLIITVTSLSATQKSVRITGQLVVCNMLREQFEMKVVPLNSKDKSCKNTQSHFIAGKSRYPSLIVNTNEPLALRLRYFGLESAWSGDIPLTEHNKMFQPWLVKVPLQESGQFLSIWCRVVVQKIGKYVKTLAMLWPLFMVRSNLPVNVKVMIETPTLNVFLETTVKGRGELQQLYCPGTTDHSHQLTFKLDQGTSASNPYVPLNYSLVNQKEFFKKFDKDDIEEILDSLKGYEKSMWPFATDLGDVNWIADDQPLTHVQVRYQNVCPYSCALLVELLPWCLLLNTFGCPIAIFENDKHTCHVGHNGVVTPPKLEGTFGIGVGVNDSWHISSPLQLAQPEWSHGFYMPKITGLIPTIGYITTAVSCGRQISVLLISSEEQNEMKILRVSASHIIVNHTSLSVSVFCMAVPDSAFVSNFSDGLNQSNVINLRSNLNKKKLGVPVTQWHCIEKNEEAPLERVLYISVSLGADYSCPVRVDRPVLRKCIAVQHNNKTVALVVTVQEFKGQYIISIHHDSSPQLLIENRSNSKIICAQSSIENPATVAADVEHFDWNCLIPPGNMSYYTLNSLTEKFPAIEEIPTVPRLVISLESQKASEAFQWSQGISVHESNEQFVRIASSADFKVTVEYNSHTTRVTIDSVSQVEISAGDIRSRLTEHEMEIAETTETVEQLILIKSKQEIQLIVSKAYNKPSSSRLSKEEDRKSSYELTCTQVNVGTQSSFIDTKNLKSFVRPAMPTLFESSQSDVILFNKRDSTSEYQESYSRDHFQSGPLLKIKDLEHETESWFLKLNINVFLRSFTLILTEDMTEKAGEQFEIIAITCDNVCFTSSQNEETHMCISISELQIDNQLFPRGGFDFPVVLISENAMQHRPPVSLSTPIKYLMTMARNNPLICVKINMKRWKDMNGFGQGNGLNSIEITLKSFQSYIEDTFITKLVEYSTDFIPSNLILISKQSTGQFNDRQKYMYVEIPEHILVHSEMLVNPLVLERLTIDPLSLTLSVHTSVKFYIALDHSPLYFNVFERQHVMTTPYRLGHALTMHYLSGAIFRAGWVVGSLEILGSPGGLARSVGSGLRDFVSLPYEGILQGPWGFLVGVTHGSASLMKHVTAGTVNSVTKLAESVARNLDRLTLDEEHLQRTEELRRQRSQGLAQGIAQGLTGFGISLLGAVGGLAHHPLQSMVSGAASPRDLVAGLGRGLVGIFTKPLSGAAELVARTGQGLLHEVGWNPSPKPRVSPVLHHIFNSVNSPLKYSWKVMQHLNSNRNILFVTEATSVSGHNMYEAVALVITFDSLLIVNTEEDAVQRIVLLSELNCVDNQSDPTLLSFDLVQQQVPSNISENNGIEMDPDCRARIVDYVRNATGLVDLPSPQLSPNESEASLSPQSSVDNSQTSLTFFVNPQARNYFLNILNLAKRQSQKKGFPVLR